MDRITLKLDDKPYLQQLLQKEPVKAKEIIATFVSMMETCAKNGWADQPRAFHPELTLEALVAGVLKGALNLPEMAPETYSILKEEVHPLSMLSAKINPMNGSVRYVNWHKHFRLPEEATVDESTIALIIRKMLRYAKYVNVEELAKALDANQVAVYRGLGHEEAKKLPFYPALRYQREHFGELHVGKFFDEIGAFDCGEWQTDIDEECLACGVDDLKRCGDYVVCPSCNAGYTVVE